MPFLRYLSGISSILACLGVCSTLLLSAITTPSQSFLSLATTKQGNHPLPCNCVIFRMDDVQDNFVDIAQLTTMNLFMSKNQSLTLGLIMSAIGNDTLITGQVAEGIHKGLFELALHGWGHVDYTKLSEQQQKDSLEKANNKMLQLYGNRSNIFITPYGTFNNDTIKAMSQLDIKILSAATFSESEFDKNNSIFNANIRATNTSSNPATTGNVAGTASVYHVPAMTFFKDDEANKRPVKIPIKDILTDVDNDIRKYGYAVIVFHPQDFVKIDQNGKFTKKLDQNELNDLAKLIDSVLLKKIPITTMSKLVGIEPRGITAPPNQKI